MSPAYDPSMLSRSLTELRETPIDAREKGFGALGPISPRELSEFTQPASDLDFTFPLMVAKESAIRHNASIMAEWCAARQIELAPHAKTTMSPQIIAMQLQMGAWAITVATYQQFRVVYSLGVRRILIANQVTDRASLLGLAKLTSDDPSVDVACFVDSVLGVELLKGAFGSSPNLSVFVELGVAGGRSGVRSADDYISVAKAAQDAGFAVSGPSGFEGILGHDRSLASLDAVRRFCHRIRQASESFTSHDRRGISDGFGATRLVSLGGSLYFDIVAEELGHLPDAKLLLRSGGYIVLDEGYLGALSPLVDLGGTSSFEVWAPVLSVPERSMAIVLAGKRDLPADLGLPIVLGGLRDGNAVEYSSTRATQMDDQHLYLRLAAEDDIRPGDVVRLVGPHPCTAFDKWRAIPLLSDDDKVVNVLTTHF